MRLISTRLMTAILLLAAALPALAIGPATFQNLQAALDAGIITPSEAALNKVHFAFEPEKVDPRFFEPGDMERKFKDATWVFHSILIDPEVDPSVKDYLQARMDEPFDRDREDRATYYSPMGWFMLIYYTTGGNAVPATDGNSNGVPDFVEWCASYLDSSWQTEIEDLGFIAPYVASGGAYQITFEDMSYYGYTTIVNPSLGQTRIVLHNDFLGFPANDDPEGDQKGAAKVTCAHEFKHASQYKGSRWTESGWVEEDAVWTEEIVFPQVNDYHNYIAYTGSPLFTPEQSLDYGGSGSYEDAIHQIHMSEVHGEQLIVDLWDYRVTHTGVSMINSYDWALQQYGSNFEDDFEEFVVWNDLTGYYSVAGFGYPDAPDYYSRKNWLNLNGLTTAPQSGTVSHLATRFARHFSINGLADHPKVVFNGQDGIDIRPHLIVKKNDGTMVFYTIEVDGNNDATFVAPLPFSELTELHLTFPNCERTGSNNTFSYELLSDTYGGTDVPGEPGYAAMRLLPNYPNPFNPKTTLRFELAADASVTLEVLSSGGRVLRHLLDGQAYSAGTHELVFDGLDDSGHRLASGVYFTRLSTGGNESQVRKIQLLK